MEGLLDAVTRIPVIEIAIGMFFLYLLMSLLVSVIQEYIAKLMNRREKVLENSIIGLIGSEAADDLYRHPLIRSLYVKGKKPAYIPSRSFAIALLEVLRASNAETEDVVDEIRDKLKKLENPLLRGALLIALKGTEGSVEKALDNIGSWFDEAMNSVSAWYKARSQYISFGLAVVLVVGFNADTIMLTRQLWSSPALRSELADQAQAAVAELSVDDRSADAEQIRRLNDLIVETQLTLGWWDAEGKWIVPATALGIFMKVLGLLITIFAISLGAPFWFDLLNKILRYRKPKSES